jgi:diaminopimelate decarboxylase
VLSHEETSKIAETYGSPFYLFDESAFVKNYDEIVQAFSSRYQKFILAYSYKTNYIPYLCRIIKSKGACAEVVSRLEYDLALKIGQEPDKIIFNGPVKHYEDIELALKNHSLVNLDSWYEVGCVAEYAKRHADEEVRVGLRINIGLSDGSGVSHVQEELGVGRFGFDPNADNIQRVISNLRSNANVLINGLHGHTSTTDRSVWCYEVITETLCNIASSHIPDTVEYINIGGGIFGHIPPEMQWTDIPSFDDYATAVCDVLKKSAWVEERNPYLVLEPGVSMAANTLSFVTKVVSVKSIRGKIFVVVDGSAFNTKPTFHKINQPYDVIKKTPSQEREIYSVVGSTCMEKDYLLTEINGVKLEEGDFVKISNVGAYTLVLAPPFINLAPAIVVKGRDGCKAIRKRQSLDNMFSDYLFE